MLFALGIFLILVLAAVITLNTLSSQSRLSQLAFIYEADVSKLGLSFRTFAPISIAPTLVSIVIGLWWDQLDMTLRILQPYISMSRQPTTIARGAGLTYRSKTWVGAAAKAARNKHFILFMITVGSVLCQVCKKSSQNFVAHSTNSNRTVTVSMSALFERQAANVLQSASLTRTLSLRQAPIITKIGMIEAVTDGRPLQHVWEVLDTMYSDPPKNWLAGASIQLSLNGTHLPWTSDGWSFVPIDLSDINSPSTIHQNDSDAAAVNHSTNVTLQSNGIRARLECNPIAEVSDTSSWLARNKTELERGVYWDNYDLEGLEDSYWLNHTMFNGTPSNTSVFADWNMVRCCSNETSGATGKAAIGYWSPTDAQKFSEGYPQVDKPWPVPLVTKWIVGTPIQKFNRDFDPNDPTSPDDSVLLFKEAPSLQAARCEPVIEVIQAMVTVDKDTAAIISFEPLEAPNHPDAAWSEAFKLHDLSTLGTHYNQSYTGPLNITTR
jgi:hypothetical protein